MSKDQRGGRVEGLAPIKPEVQHQRRVLVFYIVWCNVGSLWIVEVDYCLRCKNKLISKNKNSTNFKKTFRGFV